MEGTSNWDVPIDEPVTGKFRRNVKNQRGNLEEKSGPESWLSKIVVSTLETKHKQNIENFA